MVVLALDTTSRTGSVAVLRDTRVLVERHGDPEIPHGRRLPADLLVALSDASLALADVDLFAVASGPGAFTGLRVGIATVQGLAFAHGRPVAAVSALDALAHVVLARRQPDVGTFLAAWMDAARGEVFSALYEVVRQASSEPVERDGPSVDSADATLARWQPSLIGRSVLFAGDGALRYQERISTALATRAVVLRDTPALAGTIGLLALRHPASAGSPHAVRPLYVRRPDAELARERALTGDGRG